MPLRLDPSFRERLASSDRALIGMWACSGSTLVTEVAAGSGLDWLLIDMEHSTNTLESVLLQLQTVAAYPITPLVRVPSNDTVAIKQILDLGAQNLIVPMVSSADEARAAVAATRYPHAASVASAVRWRAAPAGTGSTATCRNPRGTPPSRCR